MVCVLLGPPLSGKSKVGTELYNKLGIEYISTGEIVRDLLNVSETFNDEYGDIVNNGNLLPDEVIEEIVANALQDTEDFIIDGFPRNKQQAKWFDEFLRDKNTKLDKVFMLSCEDEELDRRLSIRKEKLKKKKLEREDDRIEVLETRIKNYKEITYNDLYLYYNELIDIDTTNLSITEMVDAVIRQVERDIEDEINQ